MDNLEVHINSTYFQRLNLAFTHFQKETESDEYDACRFQINKHKLVYRKAKVTPKKVGQFVTFWKRQNNSVIAPLHQEDDFDFYFISIKFNDHHGVFIFPKSILVEKGIVSTKGKEGKRGFRVYPAWDKVKSAQAIKTQKWQQAFFYNEVDDWPEGLNR